MKQQNTSLSPQWCRTARVSQRAWAEGAEASRKPGQGPGTPLVACPPQGKPGNWSYFGHFSQRGSLGLMPRNFPHPMLTTHPSKQHLIKQKEQREGAGGGRSWGREGRALQPGAGCSASPSTK